MAKLKVPGFEDVPEGAPEANSGDPFFGKIDLTTRNIVAKPISIYEIAPDARQPRRAIPWQVRAVYDGTASTVTNALERWFELAEAEAGHPIPLQAFMEMPEDFSPPEESGEIERGLMNLIKLARNIAANGLNEPIEVAREEGSSQYKIVFGELRWLAYHLLRNYYNDQRWSKIHAQVKDTLDVWRQAAENGLRRNLNAIALARQLALLIIDLYQKSGHKFRQIEELVMPGECDRVYYAQVADGKAFPLPYGKGHIIAAVMGINSADSLRLYRALLRLPDEAWKLADDYNIPEINLRACMNDSIPDEQKIEMVRGMIKPVSKETDRQPKVDQSETIHHIAVKAVRRIAKAIDKGDTISREDVHAVREWLDEIERGLA
jgi:hypothetical protein